MFRITVDESQIQAAFNRLKAAATDATPAFKDIGEYFLKRVDDSFRNEVSPYGSPWAALKPRTIKQKQKKRQITKILQSTGLFRASFSYDAGADFAEVGSNRVSAGGAPIGLFHQMGSRNLPKRATLPDERGLPPQDLEEVLAILEEHITGAW